MVIFKKCSSPIWITIFFIAVNFNPLNAQTNYFAGTPSGTGNTGSYVTGVGYLTLNSSNSGANNSAFGAYALSKNTAGYHNTGIGYASLYNNTTGYLNTSIGKDALYSNTTGNSNNALGYEALRSNTTGSYNTAIGIDALYSNTAGAANNAVGYFALRGNSSGNYNNALGHYALYSNTTGSYNNAVGYLALNSNTTGSTNNAFGYGALMNNTTGYWNNAFGHAALKSNTIGSDNTAFGLQSLQNNINGSQNSGIGSLSLATNTTGNANIAIGYYSMTFNTTGGHNAALGTYSLSNNNGDWNVAVGNLSMGRAGNSDKSVSLGASALVQGTFLKSIGIGYKAGGGYDDGTSISDPNLERCILIGDSIVMQIGGLVTNSIAIGSTAVIDASNKVRIGNTAITSIGGQVGWTTYSDKRLKTNFNKSKLGLDFILSLNPVTYNYKAEGQKDILYTGLIAQEVDEAATKAGVAYSAVDKNGEMWGIRYGELTVPLIKAMQELNDQIKELKSELSALKNQSIPVNAEARLSSSLLYQNNPNPFNQQTSIVYKLSSSDKDAAIVIRNINGSIVKQLKVLQAGTGKVTINANELSSGTYTYSLLVNGNIADTKLMVITK